MTGTTLITGADGYLGSHLAARLLASGEDVLLAVRASGPDELAAKRDRLTRRLGGGLRVVGGDLAHGGWLDGIDPAPITRIVHGAAVTRFTVPRDEARAVNVEGTARLRDFALGCRDLRRLAYLSTLYAAGRRCGPVPERRLGDAGFANHYEWSKWAAESLLLDAAGELPVSVLRLPTVVADDDSGRTTRHNAFHNTLRLFYYGLLSLLPGDEATPLPLATASFTAEAVHALLGPDAPGGVFHVCPDPADTATLGEVLDTAFTVFEKDDHYRRRGLLRPLPCPRESFDDLLSATDLLRASPLRQSIASVAPFADQLYLPKTFRTDRLRAAWPGHRAPTPRALVEAVARELVASRWGRRDGADQD